MVRKLKGTGDHMCLTVDCHDELIISGYEKGLVKLWDLRHDDAVPVLIGRCRQNTLYDDISSLSFGNQNSQEIFVSSGKYIYHFDLRKVEEASWNQPRYDFNEDDINQITISDNDEMLAAADDNRVITIIDLKNSRLLTTLKKHKSVVYATQFRPGKSRELVSGGYDCSIIHWDVFKSRVIGAVDLGNINDPNWELPKSFNPSYVLCCEFGSLNCHESKSNILVAGTDNGNLHCFHCEKNMLHYKTFRAHDLGVTQVRCLKSFGKAETLKNGVMLSGSNDGKIKFWSISKLFMEPTEASEVLNIIEHGSQINCLNSIKGEFIIVCDTSSDITLLPINP